MFIMLVYCIFFWFNDLNCLRFKIKINVELLNDDLVIGNSDVWFY